MQIRWRQVATRLAVLVGLIAGTPAPSRAVGFTLDVLAGDQSGSFSSDQLGCSDTGATTAHCAAQGLSVGDLLITNLDMNLDTDPSVNGVIAVQNMAAGTQQFQLTITLLTGPIGPSTLTGGSVAGGTTDNTGNGSTLSTVAGSALYSARIDGVAFQTLFPDPTSLTVVSPFESADLTPPGAFGTPIPSLAGPAVASSIGIRYDFLLTAGDAASFTGVFVVEPIPEPSTGLLLGFGLLAVAAVERRHR